MHFQLPKPLHGWREFAGEIAIIVIGVSIALGAEQALQTIHDRTIRAEARDAIEGEIGRNLDAFRRRSEVQNCINSRLREVETLLTTTPLGAPLPKPLWIGRPQIWGIAEARLEAATSGARTALLTGAQQAGYSEVYNNVRILAQAQDIEQLAWARLRALETLPSIDGQSRANLIEALHEARYANFRIIVASAQSLERAEAIGIEPGRSPYGKGSRSACIPMDTPREQALKMTMIGRYFLAEP